MPESVFSKLPGVAAAVHVTSVSEIITLIYMFPY